MSAKIPRRGNWSAHFCSQQLLLPQRRHRHIPLIPWRTPLPIPYSSKSAHTTESACSILPKHAPSLSSAEMQPIPAPKAQMARVRPIHVVTDVRMVAVLLMMIELVVIRVMRLMRMVGVVGWGEAEHAGVVGREAGG